MVDYLGKEVARGEDELLNTTYRGRISPLGFGRLKVVDMFVHMFRSDNTGIIHECVKNGLIGTVLKMILKYEWNNILHSQIEKILMECINMSIEGKSSIV